MSSKLPEIFFPCRSESGKLKDLNYDDLDKFLLEHEGEDLFMFLKPVAKASEKMKMYAYYHVNVLKCAVIGYTAAGWEGIDEVKADYLLRAQFAKDFVMNPKKQWEPVVLDKREMTKARLLRYMVDCIFFIEEELKTRVPSSDEYKLKVKTGREFRPVNE
jgi:hypothetical protein